MHPWPPLVYQWLLVLVGFDAADEVGLTVGQNFHQLLQGLLELACQGGGPLGGVCVLVGKHRYEEDSGAAA